MPILLRLHANELARSSFHYHYHHHLPRRLAVYCLFFSLYIFFTPSYSSSSSSICLKDQREPNKNQVAFRLSEVSIMSSFTRRNEGNDAYLMNHQMAMPGSYGQPESHDFKQESHDFNTHGSGSYHFPQHSFNPYGSQFGQPYGPQSSLSPGLQHLQYTSEHSIPSMTTPDDPRLHHPPQFMSQSRYLQGPRYLPRDPLGETEIESQESHNEVTLLSEAVVPALSGFPDVKEFDQLMQKWVIRDQPGWTRC